MGVSHTRTCHLIICGIEREVEVDFTIDSYGTADSWEEPGDAPEICVDKVMSGDRDITAFCNEVRDLWGDKGSFIIAHHGYDKFCGVERKPVAFVGTDFGTLLEACEEQILDNFHEYETDPFWYDDGYH